MGFLAESASWSDGIPYFEANAVLTGGPDCPDNVPIAALANRTVFLKKQIDDAVSGALAVMSANKLQTARNIAMTGDGSWVVTFDGSGGVTAAMTLANTGVAAGTYPVVTIDSKGRVTAARALQSADLPNNAALTGVPTAPTAAPGTNTPQLANTAFVQAAIAALVASSPAALDTLNELAAALGNDPNFATTITNALAGKAALVGSNAQTFSVANSTQSQHALPLGQAQGLFAAQHGQCRLILSSGNLKLVPFNGNKLVINGTMQTVPSVGITLAATGLTAGTLYYIYAYMNAGTMTLEAATTTHATDVGTGVEIKSGDVTRTLVGMAVPLTGPAWADTSQNRNVASYFNQPTRIGRVTVTSNVSTASTSQVELSTSLRVTWVGFNNNVTATVSGTVANSSAGSTTYTGYAVDGSTAEYGMAGGSISNATYSVPAVSTGTAALSDGYHYATVVGYVTTGTGTWQGGQGLSMNVTIPG